MDGGILAVCPESKALAVLDDLGLRKVWNR